MATTYILSQEFSTQFTIFIFKFIPLEPFTKSAPTLNLVQLRNTLQLDFHLPDKTFVSSFTVLSFLPPLLHFLIVNFIIITCNITTVISINYPVLQNSQIWITSSFSFAAVFFSSPSLNSVRLLFFCCFVVLYFL